ncbi:MAG: hypothetical protein EOM19_06850 [Candidatus Moranbacteria bacterium]|nr:hypothetical protein [Candidatus Moranbacteria bacterium]
MDNEIVEIGVWESMLIYGIWFGAIIISSYYNCKVAKKLNMNKGIAIVAGILLPVLGALIYSHLNYSAERKKRIYVER